MGNTKASNIVRSVLSIDLNAIAANYNLLKKKVAPASCAAVLKADAYGLGVDKVAPRLWQEGCRIFFVASIDEAIKLREKLPEAEIVTLNGLLPEEIQYYYVHRIIPTLNDLGQIDAWTTFCRQHNPMPAFFLELAGILTWSVQEFAYTVVNQTTRCQTHLRQS